MLPGRENQAPLASYGFNQKPRKPSERPPSTATLTNIKLCCLLPHDPLPSKPALGKPFPSHTQAPTSNRCPIPCGRRSPLTLLPTSSLSKRVCTKSLQSCLILCNPMDRSPPGSCVCGILQVRILEWVPMPFSRGSPNPGIGPRSSAVLLCRQILYH